MNDIEIPNTEQPEAFEEQEPIETSEPSEVQEPEEIQAPISADEESPEVAQPAEPEVAEVKKRPSFMVRALRWLLIIAILFGLGSILILFTLYIPTRENLNSALQDIEQISNQANADLEQANQEILRLSSFEEKNQALQEELDQSNLRVTVLEIRNDVLSAQLALLHGDKEKALLALSNTPETMDVLAAQLPTENRDYVTTMQKRLELAIDGIQNEDSAAESDLNVLVIKLLELEDALFR